MSSAPPAGRDRANTGLVDLAATGPFELGGVSVHPATRQVLSDTGREVLAEPRVLQVLIALKQADGAVVSRDELIERCWDGRIVGEDAINRAIAKARQLAELTTPTAFVIETIPRVGYRLKPGAGGASAREPEPDAAAAPRDTDAAAQPQAAAPARVPRFGRRAVVAGGAAAAAAAAAAFGVYGLRRPGAKPSPLVAVLPFDNLSPDAQLGYFADGLSEDILNALTRGGGVRVTARTSSFHFRGPGKANAAAALKADYLLDGSVLRDGARLRVNAHLSDVAKQQTLWSESYDRDVGQGLQIEDDIAARVASALRVRLTPGAGAARLIDPVAYDLYLRGREAARDYTAESARHGVELLRGAVERSPEFAAGWLELAKGYAGPLALMPVPQQLRDAELGRRALQRALALDPQSGAGIGLLGELTPPNHHWEQIEATQRRGLALAPNDPDVLYWRGRFLCRTGRLGAAVALLRQAWALDPLYLRVNHNLYWALMLSGRLQEAGPLADRIAAIWPGQIAAYWDRFWVLAWSGRELQAAALAEDRSRRPPDRVDEYPVLAEALRAAVSGSAERRRAAAGRCMDLAGRGLGYACNSMVLLAQLHQEAEALELARSIYLQRGRIQIDRAVQFVGSRYPIFGEADTSYLFLPHLAALRRSGRLDDIFEGIGLATLWARRGRPD